MAVCDFGVFTRYSGIDHLGGIAAQSILGDDANDRAVSDGGQ
jgi:hypothetical protein